MSNWETPSVETLTIEKTQEGGSAFIQMDKTWADENGETVADYKS